jgi:glycosyltransferase involved in cell wall biosynthesis
MNTPIPLTYVLITAARDEEAFIGETIRSVVSQTVRPQKWVIVSDGSTDHTDEIAKDAAARFQWIEFLRMPPHSDRHFAAKVKCFKAGSERVRAMPYDIIGNLDADLSFEKDHFEYLLAKFGQDPTLGVAGTPFIEKGSSPYDYRFTNIDHVSGACQLFRRECFEEIGGYIPIKGGGIDWAAVTTARMKGWTTRTFTERLLHHHRRMGTGKTTVLGASYKLGIKDYSLGNHPLWEVFRMLYQMRYKPYVLGGLALYAGYLSAAIRKKERPLPLELIRFHRREQLKRLSAIAHYKKQES